MGSLLWLKLMFLTAARNLWRAPRRTLVSLMAIAASAAALVLFHSFLDGVTHTFRENVITSRFGHFQIFAEGGRGIGKQDTLEHLLNPGEDLRPALEQAVAPVKMISRQLSFFGILGANDRSTGARGLGIDAGEEKAFLTLTQVVAGKHLADSPRESVFIGQDLAKKVGVVPGDMVQMLVTTQKGAMNLIDLEVCGLFQTGVTELDENVFFVHHELAETTLQVQGAQKIILGFDTANEKPLQPKLEQLFKSKFPGLEIVHWEVLATYFANTMGWLERIFQVFRVIIIIIATLSITNVFTMSLLERTGEFGTLRAIGTQRWEITLMIFIEAMIQALIGSILGILLGIAVIKVGLAQGIKMPPPLLMSVPFHVTFQIPWAGVWSTLVLCVGIAGGSGIFPAIRMARFNIVQALGRNV